MKTHTIKTPTAELMIIELPLWFKSFSYKKPLLEVRGNKPHIEGYTLLGKPDEISEEDAAQLIPMYFDHEKTAVEYLVEMIDSEIYWSNPHGTRESNALTEGGREIWRYSNEHFCKWQEAEQKTFDRNRTLIFVKN